MAERGLPDRGEVLEAEVVSKKPVVHATVEKKSLWQRLRGSIFVAGPKEVKESLIEDVIKPSIRDFIADGLYTIVDVAVYGKSSNRRRCGGRVVSRDSKSPIDFTQPSREKQRRRSSGYDFNNLYFADRYEADEVFDALVEELQDKGEVSVYYFYELAGVTAEYTDQSWGWTSLEGTGYNRGPDGVALALPKPVPLRK
jgi:hypothetical protein